MPEVKPVEGTFPFGAPLRGLYQEDRTPKRVFVLGVYASAVHATWLGDDGRVRVSALAVASEPSIFWNGADAEALVSRIAVPAGAGRLEAASPFNGPSGRSLDEEFLGPLGLTRESAWLCDLVPHACLNDGQLAAIAREYEPRAQSHGLPQVDVPPVPTSYADEGRRREIVAEIEEAQPEIIVLLGDQPIRQWLRFEEARWQRLADFGSAPGEYGRLHAARIHGRSYHVLPLAHPRQVSGLGAHSSKWRGLHADWKRVSAPRLLLNWGDP